MSRIPFAEAISEPLLLKKQFYGDGTRQFPGLSVPQQTVLKVFYGLPLDQEGKLLWSLLQGSAVFDELGYPTKIIELPYIPKEYESTVLILGRRSGKTSGPLAFSMAYEATLGGHLDYVAKKQECALFLTAQTLDYASDHIAQFVLPIIEDSPMLAKRIKVTNTDGIVLTAGIKGVSKTVGIRPAPPKINAFRGPAIPMIGMDEAAFWYKDSEAANPDYEVERAVDKAMGQFPNRKKIVASTVWTKEGIVWDAFNAGTDGQKFTSASKRKRWAGMVLFHAPTPSMANPLLTKEWFQKEYDKDPEAYKREILSLFVDAIDGIFTESLLRAAMAGQPSTVDGVELADRPVIEGRYYIAAMDPAFKKDAFGFAIGHYEPNVGVVQDVTRRWIAKNKKNPLKPADVLDEIKPLLVKYGVVNVLSDQYHLESLQQLAQDRGFSIEGVTFTAKSKVQIYGSALFLARQGQWKLLDDDETFQELLLVQRTNLPQGGLHISAPAGRHDDMASVTVLMSHRAAQMRPSEESPVEKAEQEMKHVERGLRHVERKNQVFDEDDDYEGE